MKNIFIKIPSPAPVDQPYVSSAESTRGINTDLLIAMFPAAVWGIIAFGPRALIILLVSTLSAVLTEILYCIALCRPQTAGNLHSAVTGLMLGLLMPASVPYWLPAAGSAFAVLVFGLLLRDMGRNIISPVLGGYAFLTVWHEKLMTYPTAFEWLPLGSVTEESLNAGPIAVLRSGELPDDGIFNLLIGKCSGSIGTVSALMLFAGAVYLIMRRICSAKLPFFCLAGAAVTALLLPVTLDRVQSALCEVFGGSIIFACVFLATDYAALPVTDTGREIFAVGCGVLTVLLRRYGIFAETAPYAVLIMNLLSRPLEHYTKLRIFGHYASVKTKKNS